MVLIEASKLSLTVVGDSCVQIYVENSDTYIEVTNVTEVNKQDDYSVSILTNEGIAISVTSKEPIQIEKV
jgi:hypothetical protein